METTDDGRRTKVPRLRRTFDRHALAATRSTVSRWAREAGADERQAQSFTYAVNEVMVNAITHGGGGGDLTLIANLTDRLVAEVEDRRRGPPFDLPTRPPPPRTIGGRGLWIASQLCDDVVIERGRNGTRLVLTLILRRVDGDPPAQRTKDVRTRRPR